MTLTEELVLSELNRSLTTELRKASVERKLATLAKKSETLVSPAMIEKSQQIINEFLSASDEQHNWAIPAIAATDGAIEASWWNGANELHLFIEEDNIEYVRAWGTNIHEEMVSGHIASDDVSKLWNWLSLG